MGKYILENWLVDGYKPPDASGDLIFTGDIYGGHPIHADGETIVLSKIVDYKDGYFLTEHGNEYSLGIVEYNYGVTYPFARERIYYRFTQ